MTNRRWRFSQTPAARTAKAAGYNEEDGVSSRIFGKYRRNTSDAVSAAERTHPSQRAPFDSCLKLALRCFQWICPSVTLIVKPGGLYEIH
jgi:hypothetical protein